ncbi:SLOG family protein [Bacteroides thetaiotaomicron]|uniref:SLOG family protein n=1 Tax=Bacteroides thetaiotaomicron TaxID=818 RepID=UPI00159ED404|nr:SLOG family protein [Bacteroides thetaiotaomicron]
MDVHITAMGNNANLIAVSRRCSAAFTGHRSLPHVGTADIKAALTELIREWHGEGVTNYLCGMALGFDLMAAECVLQAKRDFNDITLTVVIPFRDQCGMWNFKDRQRYHAVFRQADFRILLSERYYKGCLLVRNDFMLSHASLIVACYDGRRRGGTFYTCNRARAMNIPVINLYDRLEE